jgi:hypothetical protein
MEYHKCTVLGPILFILYINGLLNPNIDAKIISFADDTVMLIQEESFPSIYNKANLVFKEIKLWFDNNFLEHNLEKTKHVIFSIHKETIKHNFNLRNHFKICIADKYVNCTCKHIHKVDSIKYLGLHMDNNLKIIINGIMYIVYI